ncbi:hypothetical protein DBR06_SOUSAS30010002, partial [Sousa chinensis]
RHNHHKSQDIHLKLLVQMYTFGTYVQFLTRLTNFIFNYVLLKRLFMKFTSQQQLMSFSCWVKRTKHPG